MSGEMVRKTVELLEPELHRIRTKRTTAIKLGVFASEGRHREEMERFRPSLKELMLLVRLDQQHDAGAQRDSFPVEDREAATVRHDQLVIPVVSVQRRVAALPDRRRVHRGLRRAVLPPDALSQ